MNPNIDRMPPPEMNLPGAPNGVAPEVSIGRPYPETDRFRDGMVPLQPTSSFIPPASNPTPVPIQNPLASGQQSVSQIDDTHMKPDDLTLEKQYISKAKAIIEQTKNDPYTQSNELGKVKADFLKKQYGKEIKLSEG